MATYMLAYWNVKLCPMTIAPHRAIRTLLPAFVTLLWFAACSGIRAEVAATRPTTLPAYTSKKASPDGIGKVYHGREIAKVMGHLGADWLERPEREQEERPRKAIDLMKLKPTDVVADIGAGSGYFSFRIAEKVPQGKVLAVDIQPEMLAILRKKSAETGVKNVEPVLGTESDPKLPDGGVDVVLFVDAYHEFEYPQEMMLAIVKALKPGGRLIQIEYRAEDPRVFIKPLHKMTEAQANTLLESLKSEDDRVQLLKPSERRQGRAFRDW